MAPEEYDAVDRAVRQAFASDDEDDVIDAETGEIVQESFVPAPAPKGRMTREQGQLITDIAGQLGWDKAAVQACSGEVTGITNSALLREDQAKDLIEHLLAQGLTDLGAPRLPSPRARPLGRCTASSPAGGGRARRFDPAWPTEGGPPGFRCVSGYSSVSPRASLVRGGKDCGE
jgi:hypothetical protein